MFIGYDNLPKSFFLPLNKTRLYCTIADEAKEANNYAANLFLMPNKHTQNYNEQKTHAKY
jgi:hypothetical protein